MKRGKLIIFTGPSGVGKGAIKKGFIDDPIFNIVFSISTTTRKKRKDERDGFDYHFINKKEFFERIKKDKFLEYALFTDNYYGTEANFVEKQLQNGKNVLLEIEVLGAEQVFAKFPKNDLISIFVLPPSLTELKKRLLERNTNSENEIEKRLLSAQKEITYAKKYQFKIINQKLTEAIEAVKQILIKELAINE